MTFQRLKNFFSSGYGIFVLITLVIYIAADLAGEFIGNLGANYECIRYLGCTSGFFGFDAVEHFLSGFAFVVLLALFFERYPRLSPYAAGEEKWKKAFILIATVALIAVLWEVVECAHDVFRLAILHEHLYSVKLHVDLLDQPSNLDTMGDLTFNVLGSVIAGFFVRHGWLKKPEA